MLKSKIWLSSTKVLAKFHGRKCAKKLLKLCPLLIPSFLLLAKTNGETFAGRSVWLVTFTLAVCDCVTRFAMQIVKHLHVTASVSERFWSDYVSRSLRWLFPRPRYWNDWGKQSYCPVRKYSGVSKCHNLNIVEEEQTKF